MGLEMIKHLWPGANVCINMNIALSSRRHRDMLNYQVIDLFLNTYEFVGTNDFLKRYAGVPESYNTMMPAEAEEKLKRNLSVDNEVDALGRVARNVKRVVEEINNISEEKNKKVKGEVLKQVKKALALEGESE